MNTSRKSIQLISSDGVYGAERVVLDLAGYFSKRDWDSRVVAIDCPGADALLDLAQRQGLGTHKLRAANRSLLHTLRDLRDYIAREKIDVVHAHGYKADTLLQWAGVPRGTRTVSTCHTWYSDSWRMKFYEWLDKRSLRRFDAVVVVSPQLQREVLDFGIAPQRVTLIRNGTAAPTPAADARERVRREFAFAEDDCVLVRVGRLANSKGNDILLETLAAQPLLKDVKLLFVGDGEERDALRQLADARGLGPRVSFAGYRADIADLLAAGDLFVLPSIKEGLPIALLEAMGSRLPIVSTDAGAIPIALENGRNSWVVPAGDREALGVALVQAVMRPDVRDEYAKRSYEDFQRYFSLEAMGGAYASIYEGVPATEASATAAQALQS
jgi:glycosyltransferase involved in cell wall biosynthesis